MPTSEQLKLLISTHFASEPERFHTIALQIAAQEASKGHGTLANEIRSIVDKAKQEKRESLNILPQELHGLVISEKPDTPFSSLVLPDILRDRLDRIILEYRQRHKLKAHGLTHRRKVLFIGTPGTGKTMSARVLAHELRLPIFTIQVDRLVTKFMGETSAKLRQIFEMIQKVLGLYFFDEFDAIGGERNLDNDVGEMRRVLNSFLQFIEQDQSDSLIIAATNTPKLLDRALFRRFDDVLYYDNPNAPERKRLIENLLDGFLSQRFSWEKVLKISEGLSQSEIAISCKDAVKYVILNNENKVNGALMQEMLTERLSSISNR